MHDTLPIRTSEIGFPWTRPAVTRVHLTPRAKLRRSRNRLLASAFYADLTRGTRRSLAILGAVGVLFVALMVVRGVLVAADVTGLIP